MDSSPDNGCRQTTLLIACGALAREIEALSRRWGWKHLHLKCIDAKLHNRPAEIPARLRKMIRRHRSAYDEIFVAYADCGTGGALDEGASCRCGRFFVTGRAPGAPVAPQVVA